MSDNSSTDVLEAIKTSPEGDEVVSDFISGFFKESFSKSDAARRFNEKVLGIKYPDPPVPSLPPLKSE
jgi:hypothetical protein